MIVNLTRSDLRDEIAMATEAFALSPISARAAQPSEEDYEAIREAFMETSRGRWFLTEYAKRNRNADTSMVLDAVARIEETLAAQRQQPAPENKLPEVLAKIRSTVETAKAAASAALDSLALEAHLAPIWKASRIIKEISWRWREIGADGRICDLIDSQVGAIEGAYEQLSSINASSALDMAFNLIERELGDLAEASRAEPAEAMVHHEKPAPTSEAPGSHTNAPQVAAAVPTVQSRSAAAETSRPSGPPELNRELPAEAASTQGENAEDDDARDEAVLEMVAFEMAVPDPFDEEPTEHSSARGPRMQANPEADVAVQPPHPEAAFQPVPVSPPPAQVKAVAEPSIGSTVLASGIVARRNAPSDPLAPIRRMSQAEKIAFFS
jgi:hypothetical protein